MSSAAKFILREALPAFSVCVLFFCFFNQAVPGVAGLCLCAHGLHILWAYTVCSTLLMKGILLDAKFRKLEAQCKFYTVPRLSLFLYIILR